MAAQSGRRREGIHGNIYSVSAANLLISLPLVPTEYREFNQEAIRKEKVNSSIPLSGTNMHKGLLL
jgi:hypothetical protein